MAGFGRNGSRSSAKAIASRSGMACGSHFVGKGIWKRISPDAME